jgi:hypothetical protein
MPAPPGNGHPPQDRQPPRSPESHGGINDLIAEAETLRGLLGETTTRTQRLLAALKQHRRQAKAVEAAVVSLRQLSIGP